MMNIPSVLPVKTTVQEESEILHFPSRETGLCHATLSHIMNYEAVIPSTLSFRGLAKNLETMKH